MGVNNNFIYFTIQRSKMRELKYHIMLVFCLILAPIWTSATEISCGKLFYRTLFLDEDTSTLYVGAMDRIIKIDNLNNITNTNCEKDSMVRMIFYFYFLTYAIVIIKHNFSLYIYCAFSLMCLCTYKRRSKILTFFFLSFF